jgi:hypothetical protein
MATVRYHVVVVSMLILVALQRVTAGNNETDTQIPLLLRTLLIALFLKVKINVELCKELLPFVWMCLISLPKHK